MASLLDAHFATSADDHVSTRPRWPWPQAAPTAPQLLAAQPHHRHRLQAQRFAKPHTSARRRRLPLHLLQVCIRLSPRAHSCCAPQHAYTTHTYTHSLSLLWLVKRARALAASRLRRSRFAAAKRAHSAGQPLAAGPSRGAAGLVKRASALASRHGTTRNMRLSLHLAEDLITAGDLGPSRLAHSLHSLRPSRHA